MIDTRKCQAPGCRRKDTCARYVPLAEGQEYYAEFWPEKPWVCFVCKQKSIEDRVLSMIEIITVMEFETFDFDELARTI